MALVDNARRSATVTAENDLEALVISRREFEMMLKKSPPILAALLCQLFESLRCANDLVSMYAARIAKMGEKTGRSASRPHGKRNDC